MIHVFSDSKTDPFIAALVFVHLLGTLFSASFALDAEVWPTAVYIGLIFSQVCLLGLWTGLGQPHYLVRLTVLALGILGIGTALKLGIEEDSYIYFIVFVASVVVAFVTWVVRVANAPTQAVGRDRLQFTTKHLFFLTLAVACLITTAKLLAAQLSGIASFSHMTMLGTSFAFVGLLSIWAILGLRNLVYRSLLVLLIAALTGWTLAKVTDEDNYSFWTLMFVMQAAFLIPSLMVLRSVKLKSISARSRI